MPARLNANVLRIAPQHVEASLAELGGAELTFPVFFGMLAALQVGPSPKSSACPKPWRFPGGRAWHGLGGRKDPGVFEE